jgi:membrane fusion protein, copper/silver efflux system
MLLAGTLALHEGPGHNPARTPFGTPGSDGPRRILYYVDPMHPGYTSDKPGIAPDCGMPLQPVYADKLSQPIAVSTRQRAPERVEIDSSAQTLYGIAVVPVQETTGTRTLRVPGRVAADESRVHRVSMSVDGFVEVTYDDAVGRHVRKNQRLAAIHSQEFVSAAATYIAAIERAEDSAGQDTAARARTVAAMKRNWAENLRNLGMSEMQLDELAVTRKAPEAIYLVSPVDGFILARNISAGQRFERHTEFYRIADLRRVWILGELFNGEDRYFHPGSRAGITVRNQSTRVDARVADILPQVDPVTRGVQLRLEADNNNLALRPGMLVNVDLQLPAPSGLSVPADAVVDSGLTQRVYVSVGAASFQAREVQVGERFGGRVQILRGLAQGEQVVASGTFLVDSETRLRSIAQ